MDFPINSHTIIPNPMEVLVRIKLINRFLILIIIIYKLFIKIVGLI